eukprot:TRINITY_DN91260_c0_g1_i1.p1 TRINITY_DN91260_c0_g1~~TRINITY_DN91260_c0_g1_i1.p1  ORF type:complete len:240 (+),score=28.18 TRINITY_DN91260_c0_g1_i1:193-912(+)
MPMNLQRDRRMQLSAMGLCFAMAVSMRRFGPSIAFAPASTNLRATVPSAAAQPTPRTRSIAAVARQAGPLEPLREPLQAVVDASLVVNPALKSFPHEILVWLHPVSQATVVLAFLFGAFQGLQILIGNGDQVVPVPSPIGSGSATAREAHPQYMKFSFATFLVFAVGGLINLGALDKNILDSDHASSAAAVLGLLGVQAALSNFMGIGPVRAIHGLVGTVTVFVIFLHAYLGVTLGLNL